MIYLEEYEILTEEEIEEILKTVNLENCPKIGIITIDKEDSRIEIHSILLKNHYLVI